MWQPGCWRRDNDYNDNGKGRGEIVLSGRPGGGMRDGILVYEISEAARNLLWYKPALEKPAKNPAGQYLLPSTVVVKQTSTWLIVVPIFVLLLCTPLTLIVFVIFLV